MQIDSRLAAEVAEVLDTNGSRCSGALHGVTLRFARVAVGLRSMYQLKSSLFLALGLTTPEGKAEQGADLTLERRA